MNNDFDVTDDDYQPWENLNEVRGEMGTCSTRLGRRVNVWRPHDKVAEQFRYWCHGHSLSTYVTFGFTPFSGDDVETILQDEWQNIPKKPQRGDIVVFRGRATSQHPGVILHTARIEEATTFPGMRTIISVSSKNGANKLKGRTSIDSVLLMYNDCYWFKTQTTCTGSHRIDKQYYRRLP